MVVHNISKHCSTRDFLWLLVTDVTPHFASFLTELGHELKAKSARCFKTERSESLKSFNKYNTASHFHQLLLKMLPHVFGPGF